MLTSRHLSVLTALMLSLALPACSAQKVAKNATVGTAKGLEERAKKDGDSPVGSVVGKTLADPEVKQGARELATETVQGVAPQLPDAVRGVVRGGIQGAAEATQGPSQDLKQVTRSVASSATEGIAEALSSHEASSLTPVVGDLVRTSVREAALGTSDALVRVDPSESQAIQSTIRMTGNSLGDGLGRGLTQGIIDSTRGALYVLIALMALVGAMGAIALYALWKQSQATAQALTLLARRMEHSAAE